MNWDAIGAIGEVIGAIAVVVTLIFLVIQLRLNTKAMQESNLLERAIALDRHTDSVSRWRKVLAENADLASIWRKAMKDEELSEVERIRLNNHLINFLNTQRSNFERAQIINEQGLATQASKSIAVEIHESQTLLNLWKYTSPWHKLASPEFVRRVEEELELLKSGSAEFSKPGYWLDDIQAKELTKDQG